MPDASLLMPPEQNYFVADEPRSNEDVLLGDTERGSEVTAPSHLRTLRSDPCFDGLTPSPTRVTGGGLGLQWP